MSTRGSARSKKLILRILHTVYQVPCSSSFIYSCSQGMSTATYRIESSAETGSGSSPAVINHRKTPPNNGVQYFQLAPQRQNLVVPALVVPALAQSSPVAPPQQQHSSKSSQNSAESVTAVQPVNNNSTARQNVSPNPPSEHTSRRSRSSTSTNSSVSPRQHTSYRSPETATPVVLDRPISSQPEYRHAQQHASYHSPETGEAADRPLWSQPEYAQHASQHSSGSTVLPFPIQAYHTPRSSSRSATKSAQEDPRAAFQLPVAVLTDQPVSVSAPVPVAVPGSAAVSADLVFPKTEFDAACVRKNSNVSATLKLFDGYGWTDDVKRKLSINNNDILSISPKGLALFQKMAEVDAEDRVVDGMVFKHYIFTDTSETAYGAKFLASLFLANGKTLVFSGIPDEGITGMTPADQLVPFENFALFTSGIVYGKPMQTSFKKQLFDIINDRTANSHGEKCRYVILDKKFKEGIDLFDMRYVHIFEPPLTPADQRQIVGRGTRMCGQKGLEFHPIRGWPLNVFIYDIAIPNNRRAEFSGKTNLKEVFLDNLQNSVAKAVFTSEIEDMLIEGAVDRELTLAIHKGLDPVVDSTVVPSSSSADSTFSWNLSDISTNQTHVNSIKSKSKSKSNSAAEMEKDHQPGYVPNEDDFAFMENANVNIAAPTPPSSIQDQPAMEIERKANTKGTKRKKRKAVLAEPEPDQVEYVPNEDDFAFLEQLNNEAKANAKATKRKRRTGKKIAAMSVLEAPAAAPERSAPGQNKTPSPVEQAAVLNQIPIVLPKTNTPLLVDDPEDISFMDAPSTAESSENQDFPPARQSRNQRSATQQSSAAYSASPAKLPIDMDMEGGGGGPQQGTSEGNFIASRNFIRDHFMQFSWPRVSVLENRCVDVGQVGGAYELRNRNVGDVEARNEEYAREKAVIANRDEARKALRADRRRAREAARLQGATPAPPGNLWIHGPDPDVVAKFPIAQTVLNVADVPRTSPLDNGLPEPNFPSVHDDPMEEFVPVHAESATANRARDSLSPPVEPVQRRTARKRVRRAKAAQPMSIEGKEQRENLLVQMTPTQMFIASYFQPSSPIKGMLLYHSVGAGKTCTAISSASGYFEKENYTILWVTQAALKDGIDKNLFQQICHQGVRDHVMETGKLPAKTGFRRRSLLDRDTWGIQPMSYRQFNNLMNGKNEMFHTLNDRFEKKFRERDDQGVDIFRKTLIIIDEAHNLYGETGMDIQDRMDMSLFHKNMMRSYQLSGEDSARLLLMSATPITKFGMEAVHLSNLIHDQDHQFPSTFESFSAEYLDPTGRFTPEGRNRFLDKNAGLVSYLNLSSDARQFAIPTFEQVLINTDYMLPRDLKNKLEQLRHAEQLCGQESSKRKREVCVRKVNTARKAVRKEFPNFLSVLHGKCAKKTKR